MFCLPLYSTKNSLKYVSVNFNFTPDSAPRVSQPWIHAQIEEQNTGEQHNKKRVMGVLLMAS